MNSMTGYGQAAAEGAGLRVVVTLRGVNHRFLDVSVRLPEEARGCEAALQRQIGERVERGRIELGADITATLEPAVEVEVNRGAAEALARAAKELSAAGVGAGELSVADLLRMPEVLRLGGAATGWGPDGVTVLAEATAAALSQLLEARREEGARLKAVIVEKVEALETLVSQLEALRPVVQQALEDGLGDRVEELLGGREIEPERLAQEAALLIDRSNVSEEVERLRVHLEHIGEVAGRQGAVGKRLDFLVQEIFRELNTLSAKCRSVEMTRLAVDAKVLCEEMREQLRNVE